MRCAVYSRVVSLMFASLLSPGVLVGAVQGPVLQLAVVGDAAGSIGTSSPGISSPRCAALRSCRVRLSRSSQLRRRVTRSSRGRGLCWSPTHVHPEDGRWQLAVASFKRIGDPYTVIHRFLPNDGDGLMPGSGALLDTTVSLRHDAQGRSWRTRHDLRELPDGTQHTVLHDFLGAPVDEVFPMAH